MARYLFTVWPFPGHINPNVAVAEALRARGHDVAFYTGQRASRTLRDLGIAHFPMQHVDDEAVYERHHLFDNDDVVGRVRSLVQLRRLQAAARAFMIDTVPGQVADLIPILDGWRPDAIVCDPVMWAPFLVLHDTRAIPVAVLEYSAGCKLTTPDAPPMWGRGLPPPTTWSRRLRLKVEGTVAKRVARGLQDAANAVRRGYGLAPLSRWVGDVAGTMPLYLAAGVPALDYNRRFLPPSVHYVGRLAWDRPAALPSPAWMAHLPTAKPLVYVTEGTIHGRQPGLLRAAARGLAGLPLHVLLTLTPDRDPAAAGLAALPPNVQLETQTPGRGWQSDILPRTSLVITNGGAGSVLAALATGVPLVVVPAVWDHPDNARRVVEAGAGVQLSPARCTPRRLREAVCRVLSDPSYRANAQSLAEALNTIDGPRRAAQLLEHLCAEHEQGRRQEVAVALP